MIVIDRLHALHLRDNFVKIDVDTRVDTCVIDAFLNIVIGIPPGGRKRRKWNNSRNKGVPNASPLMEFYDDQTIFNNAQRDVAATRSPPSLKYLISYYPPTDNGQIARLFTMLGEFPELFFCLRVRRVGIKLNLPYNPCSVVYIYMYDVVKRGYPAIFWETFNIDAYF